MKKRKRFEQLEKKAINRDSFFAEWPEGGLAAIESPYDPEPSIKISNGIIVEMDGKCLEEMDSQELYISKYAINCELASCAMAIPSKDIAKMIVDINVPREEVISITTAITPAKLLEVLKCLNAVETMMGQMKMRKREIPANQAHVTNITDNPVLLAADAAEAAERGFAELETTCAVSRYAPLNAIAIMVGGLSSRAGVLTQCAMEESLEVKMGMGGITSYAETISLYGTEKAMDDGNDTVWSKGFLASVYASRGIKMRCTSGTGSEVLLGHANKKSMLYLELLCVYMAKACGVQGIQNGSISCIGITSSMPEGFLAMALENLAVSLLDMEVASGNDQTFTHSDIRRTAKLLMQLLPGTDFITSGYSAVPNSEDVFAGSNTDCNDYDDYYMFQRDMQVDGGVEPITEQQALNARNRGAKALQAIFSEMKFPAITDEEVEAAVYAYSSEEMPHRNVAKDFVVAKDFFDKGFTVIDIVKALNKRGFNDVAENVLGMLKERICGDYLQVSSIFDKKQKIISGLNNPNKYEGPGTGYRLEGERWELLREKDSAIVPQNILEIQRKTEGVNGLYRIEESGHVINDEADIIIGISPGFLDLKIGTDICKLHHKILRNITDRIESAGFSVEIVKFYNTDNLTQIAKECSSISRKRVAAAIQINGRVYISDRRECADENLKGFFNIVMASPRDYCEVGDMLIAGASGEDMGRTDTKRASRVTEYQLKMVKLPSTEEEFIKKYKKPKKMRLISGESLF